MDNDPSPEHEELRRAARRFLATYGASDRVRASMENGHDGEAWRRATAELGWAGVGIPEAFGGTGFSLAELAVIHEEIGRTLLPVPLLVTNAAAAAILHGASDAQKHRLLPAIAAGESVATVAFAGAGAERVVVDGHTADLFLVLVDERLLALPASAVERRRLPTMDATRAQARITVRDLGAGEVVGDRASLRAARDTAAILLAAEQLGGAERCLEMATDYAKTRVQFGRAIGSFQAIKHKLADMLVRVESARSAVGWASRAGASELAASLARSWCSEAFLFCAAECLQIHGGIGFTWEHDAHLFFKRARASATLLGDAAEERERVARILLDGEAS